MIIAQAIANGMMLSAIYVLIAVGFTLVFSIMRIVNFAHGEFYMVGGFGLLFVYSQWDVPFALALLITAAMVVVAGAVIERVVFRHFRGDELNAMIASLGLAIIIENTVLIAFGPSPRTVPSPLSGTLVLGAIALPRARLFVLGASIVVFGLFWLLMACTKIGRAMRAMAQDPEAALIQGIRAERLIPITFGLGVGLAAVAGALMAPLFSVSPFMGNTPMLKAFVVVILGGLGSIPGAAIGGVLLGMIESFAGTMLSAAAADVLQLVLVIAILLVRPRGLMGVVGARP
jgi:branched-chain amino acid transport system permease protein